MSSSALAVIAVAIQTAQGTIATGNYQALAINSDGLTGSTNTVQSGRKSTSRLAGAALPAGFEAAGEIQCEFSEEMFDDLMPAYFASQWDTTGATEDFITLGTEPVYFTVVKYFPYVESADGTDLTRQYHVYQDCILSGMSWNMEARSIIGFNLSVAASEITFPTTAPWGAPANLLPPVDKNSLVTCSSVEDVLIGGVSSTSIIPSFSIDMTNNVRAAYDVRSCSPAEQTLDTASISGNINMLHDFDNELLFRNALNNQTEELEMQWKGETKTYRLVVPTATNTTSGPDTSNDDVSLDLPWAAINTSPTLYRSK